MAGIPLGSGFDRTSANPLDLYAAVADTTARDAIASGVRWKGMTVFVLSTNTNYQLQAGITNADWIALGSTTPTNTLIGVTAGITAFAGGGQGSATALTKYLNQVATVATSGDSVKLPAALAGSEIVVINDGASSMNIFPSTGETIDAGAANAAYALTILAKNVRFICAVAGAWKSAAGGGSSVSTTFGTYAAARSIVAATGIVSASAHMSTTATNQDIFVEGSVAATICDVASNPQIEAHTVVGAEMTIHGVSDTAPVLLEDGNGLKLNGPRLLSANTMLTLRWNGSLWIEKSWTGA
jgi:hypothetical protein